MEINENDIKKMRAQFDRYFTDKSYDQIVADNGLQAHGTKQPVTEEKGTCPKCKNPMAKCSCKNMKKNIKKEKCPDCKRPMAKCECDNAMKAKGKGKNKMTSPPAAAETAMPAAAKPPATGMMKKNMKESKTAAKVVYGLREGEEVKRYVVPKADVKTAVAAAKRMLRTRDMSSMVFVDVVDNKSGLTRTMYETLENYKARKRAFETHVVCGECGCQDLELSPKKSKIRCTRCGTTDVVENVEGVKR